MSRKSGRKKRRPVEIIESKGQRIPIYDNPIRGYKNFQFAYYVNGKRERESRSTLDAARARIKELVEGLSDGTAHIDTFDAKQTARINECIELLQPTGVPLINAVRQFVDAWTQLSHRGTIADAVKSHLASLERQSLTPVTLPDLVEKFLLHLQEANRSARYIDDMKARLQKAASSFTGYVSEIRAADINEWLAAMTKVTGRTKNNYRNALVTLFSFAQSENFLSRETKNEAEYSRTYSDISGEIKTYQPHDLQTLLDRIEPRFVPYFAIAAFTGLRNSEILQLEWMEVSFSKKVVEVKAAKAKTRARRLAPLPTSLSKWLAPFKKDAGRVISGYKSVYTLAGPLKKSVEAITSKEGKPLITTLHNGMRHSFISYRLAVLKNESTVALEAGNSPRKVFENYRELKTEEEGNAWFAVTPSPKRLRELQQYVRATN